MRILEDSSEAAVKDELRSHSTASVPQKSLYNLYECFIDIRSTLNFTLHFFVMVLEQLQVLALLFTSEVRYPLTL